MRIELLEKISRLDDEVELHMARIIILIYIVTNKGQSHVHGITKLVKLDFLLRYTKALERGLLYLGKQIDSIGIKQYEIENVESKMIRFKYGPWDPIYRTILSLLFSKGLIIIEEDGNAIKIKVTYKGKLFVEKLINTKEFEEYIIRSNIIKVNFNRLSATQLKNLMYELIPELKDMKMGEEIEL